MRIQYIAFFFLLFGISLISATWLDESFPYRQVLSISNPNTINYTNFVLNLTFDSATPIAAGKMLSNCSDLRFSYVTQSGSEEELSYFLYQDVSIYGTSGGKCAGGNINASVFLNVPVINASTTIYIYYGNSLVASKSNPNTTYLFYDYPVGTVINTTKWTTLCASATCDVINNEIRLAGNGGDWARIRIKDFNGSSNLTNKKLLFMGRQVSTFGGYSIVETETATGVGWLTTAIGNAFVPLRIDYNSSGSFGYNINTGAMLPANGDPKSTVAEKIDIMSGNLAGDHFRVTNVTLISLSKLPIVANYLLEENNFKLNISAKDDDDGKYIHVNYSVSNSSETFLNNTYSLNHIIGQYALPLGSITLTIHNSSYLQINYPITRYNFDQNFSPILIPKISKNFTIFIYDANTYAQIYFNATISNSTTSFTTSNGNTYTNSTAIVPYGTISITPSNASYYSQTFYSTNDYTKKILSYYLLSISNPNNIYVRFWITNGNGLAVENALISIKQNGYNFGDKYTDSSGGTFFWMDSTKIYTINVTSSEGNIYRNSFTPIQNDYYISVGTSQYITFDFLFTNLTLSFFPDPRIIYPNASFINFTITSIDNKLEWFGLVLIENNTMFYNGSTVSTSGGSITAIINTTNHTQTIFVHPYFKKVGYPEYYSDTIALYVYNGSQYFNYTGLGAIVVGVRNSFGITKTNTKNNLALGISLLTIGFLFSAFIARYIGVGSGMIAMLVLVLVAFFGVFSPSVDPTTIISGYEAPDPTYWGWLLWICLVVISIIVLRIIG